MGQSGSALEESEHANGGLDNGNSLAPSQHQDLPSGLDPKQVGSKNSLKRNKRNKNNTGGIQPDTVSATSGSNHDLAAITSPNSANLPDITHFGSFQPHILTNGDEHSSRTPAFLGRYTPFPPPPNAMLSTSTSCTPAAQQKGSQPPSSFTSGNGAAAPTPLKPLLADPRMNPVTHPLNVDMFGVDANTLVVLQDYEAGDARNLIPLRQGDALHLVSIDRTAGTYEVCLPDAMPEASSTFFIPQSVAAKCRNLDSFPWFHGKVSRAEAERLLSSGIDGTFLVRESESSPGQLSVSLRSGQRVHHYRLTIDVGLWFLSPEWRFRTVPNLVRHHSRHPDGLACPLLYPAPRLSLRSQTPPSLSNSNECWELDRTDLRVMRRLGGGQYGEVYEAIWLSRNIKVAVKTLRLDCAMGEREFLQEARVMTALRHPNLVKLLGVVSRERPFYIVTEFMSYGNLQDFLRSRQTRPEGVDLLPVVPVLLRFACDVASAMQYLEQRHFIHRDLAARNCLVTEELPPGEPGFAATGKADRLLVKVGDFGLARLVGAPSGKGAPQDAAYTANATGQFPIKWTAPEGLAYQRFSTKSDVWAFGILLWEIVTRGASPYPSVELSGVYALLERGYRMEQPADCSVDVYQIMRDCWRWEPVERPSFEELLKRLTSILESGEDIYESAASKKLPGDRFYEQLSNMPQAQTSTSVSTRPFVMETSTFGQPFSLDAERPRSGSCSSPSPTKAALNSGLNNGNIARCRPHNFSFRPTGTSPGKPVLPPEAPPAVTLPASQIKNSNSGDSLISDANQISASSFVLRRGSSDNKTLSSSTSSQQPSNNSAVAELLITPNKSIASTSNGSTGYATSAAALPCLPAKPPSNGDFSNRVTAELAEQMRRRRARAEQTEEELSSEQKQQSQQNNPPAATNITLQRHSTDPVVAKPTNNGSNNNVSSSSSILRQQPADTMQQPLVSGHGKPIAPVKPSLRRLQQQQQQNGGGDAEYTSPTASTRNPTAILLRGPSPMLQQSNGAPFPPTNVNWTWDDVHRLSQAIIASLSDDAAQPSAMSASVMNRLPSSGPSSSSLNPSAALQFNDLAAALDSLADSLPPRSRFQVRQLVLAIRTPNLQTPITTAQVHSVLNLIPPPSLLTTSTASLSTTSATSTNASNANGNAS